MSFYEEISRSSKEPSLTVGRVYPISIQDYMYLPVSGNDHAHRVVGFEQAKKRILAIFAEYERHMKLNIDMRNDVVDLISGLKLEDE